jgi:predicted N-acyltransferase
MTISCSILDSLSSLSASEWNALAGDENPFIRYEFLSALENNDCLHPWGWQPQYVVAHDSGKLVGAVPMYLKDNSYGEFVFDWSWADAYARHGVAYYPKLVVAVPYTPVTGKRLLANNHEVKIALIQAAHEHARQLEVSSLHWLFTDEDTTGLIEQQGFMPRSGCQFHWHNNHHQDFDGFLATLSSKKRKQIKRERRRVYEANIELDILNGHQTTDEQWQIFHEFYCSTFYRKSGHPTLTLDFFRELGRSMPDSSLLILARHNGEYVAGAFNMRGSDSLFGRHWGCRAHFDNLHFEVCYYAAIEYCIDNGLRRFEAGAQGEHKLSRGFLPTTTWSVHWLSHPAFSAAISDFLDHEKQGIKHYIDVLTEHSPYKQ